MKIAACIGFMILGIIINVGGVPTDDRGYIGGKYWYAMVTKEAVAKSNSDSITGMRLTPRSTTDSMASAPSLSPQLLHTPVLS